MWGCSSRATVRASRTKRTASDGDGVSPRSTTFTATSRRGRCSRARNTAANPPSPSRSPTVNSSPRACCRRWRNVEISRDMTDAKPRKAGAAALGTAALATAWRNRDRLRGASTITQQLAKNLYLSPSRNPLRKLKEGVTALRLELALPKDRIFQLYLDVVEWGPGLWGADAASRAYFGVPASQLNESQAAALAATLPHPRTSNPTFQPDRMLARRDLILARYHGVEVYIPPAEETDTLQLPAITVPPVESLQVEVPTPGDTAIDTTVARKDSL